MPFNFDNAAQRWREILLVGGVLVLNRQTQNNEQSRQGRFVPNREVVQEMRVHQLSTFDVLESLTRQLYSGSISIQNWQIGVTGELKDAHLAQSMYAVGGRHNMTSVEFGRVGGVLADEYRHLQVFAEGIANGTVSEAQALARIKQYGKATQQSYWREFAQASDSMVNWVLHPAEHCGDCLSLNADNPHDATALSTYPGAGDTQCRGNCQCTLERVA